MSSYEITGARLTVPFQTGGRDGHTGRVEVVIRPNDDPVRSGHTSVIPEVEPAALQGFPVVTAHVLLDVVGPAGVFGWVQLVTQRLDRGRIHRAIDAVEWMAPMCAFGYLPTFMDAPATPGDVDTVWSADTFLVCLPDVSRTRHLQPLCGFQWGYRTVDGRPAGPLPLRTADAAGWRDFRVVLEREYPDWHFDL